MEAKLRIMKPAKHHTVDRVYRLAVIVCVVIVISVVLSCRVLFLLSHLQGGHPPGKSGVVDVGLPQILERSGKT